jgi:hypothetical protein
MSDKVLPTAVLAIKAKSSKKAAKAKNEKTCHISNLNIETGMWFPTFYNMLGCGLLSIGMYCI